MKSRKGLSEIISAIIVIAVVVAGLGVYVGLSEQRILGETSSVKDVILKKNNQVSEMIKFIDMFKETDTVSVFVHNYGLKNITINNVIINGTQNIGNLPNGIVFVRDMAGNTIWPNNNTIPFGNTAEIFIDFSNIPPTPSCIDNIVIKTDSDNLIQMINSTGC